ncbi:GDP-fucose protein O-fucosyltransferase 2-like [Mya arenaria]|uniref:GDP-fucose protein O-fucosyltransferase 2-like n=1 Tax=Mya arenaria TaxID=6604 RepID=UPI0022E6B0D8|nr:GDP-fucose protein O-fucosyltransferase 2-like [Mya arenaria]
MFSFLMQIAFLLSTLSLHLISGHNDGNLYQAKDNLPEFGPAKPTRYLLYDVNPGEGFNLRRDVYMRVANMVKFLNEVEPWVLVLPPWGRLYHWQSGIQQTKQPWRHFFDVNSLALLAPVMEFEDYLKTVAKDVDHVYYLQRFKGGWSGKWEEKMEICECVEQPRYRQLGNGLWEGQFFGYENFYAKKFDCLSAQAYYVTFKDFLVNNSTDRSVFLDRAETLIHGRYSEWSPEWWTARRSMVFAKQLRDIGDKFRKDFLDSDDQSDKTELEVWTQMKRKHGEAKGGPYAALHLRRKDYLYAHKKEVPSLENAAKQIAKYLKKYKLKKLFLSTDAPADQVKEFKELVEKAGYEVFKYTPTSKDLEILKDGGVAIIDQWICAHAQIFVGTYVSTFSFRIQEEREIMGFNQEATFNRLCGDEEGKDCEQPTKWDMKL